MRPGDGKITTTKIRAFPALRGYVQTKKKEKANLELVAYADRKAEPLLASWNLWEG